MQEVPEQIDNVIIMLYTATEVTLHFVKQVVLWKIFFSNVVQKSVDNCMLCVVSFSKCTSHELCNQLSVALSAC